MFHFIGAIILFIITIISHLVCPKNTIIGGNPLSFGTNIMWFDPKKFVTHNDWQIGTGTTPTTWEKVDCKTNKEWQNLLIKHNHDGLSFANSNMHLQWKSYEQLPLGKETQYLRDYKCNIKTLQGVNGFLMTPFLREWQSKNILKYIPENSKLFDIGIGTGRSKDLWVAKHAQVYGVEPYKPNYDKLMQKRMYHLKDARNWGGENPEILTWIPKHSMDVVMMSYSITFFFENPEKLTALLNNIDHSLKSGGVFIMIGMDGSVVNKWPKLEIDNECFKITKKYKKLQTFGSEIEITMKNPFTLVEAQKEFLVDFKELEQSFTKRNYKLLKNENVKAPYYLAEWPSKFVSAQRFMVFQKN